MTLAESYEPYGSMLTSDEFKWYEGWFNFWDYLFDANEVSVADIRNAQCGTVEFSQ